MNLVFIYGPPASGKLTVAQELVKLTGYLLFHNHLTYDYIHGIFGNIDIKDLNHRIRLEVFKQAVESGVRGMIFTFVFGYGLDEGFVRSVKEIIESKDGRVYFIQLVCDKDELYDRITQESRGRFQKIKTKEKLDQMFQKYNITTTIPSNIARTHIINNTRLSPDQVATKINDIIKSND